MEFTLYIKGKINSNGTAKEKHDLRLDFHHQLKLLWELDWWKKRRGEKKSKENWKEKIKKNQLYKNGFGKHFICLVRSKMSTYVELNINFYVPKNTSFCDIDNKLKTICDALQFPTKTIKNWNQKGDEDPLICLLENDKLIYKLNADTDFILNEQFFDDRVGRKKKNRNKIRNNMLCVINVKIKGNKFIGEYNDLIV
jgi:hypothetical protein